MTETVLIAIIAVAGTALGAAVSPLTSLLTTAIKSRSDERSVRLKAVADFGTALRKHASTVQDSWDPSQVRLAQEAAIAQRFEIAKTIRRGDSRVDWFCELLLDKISKQRSSGPRIAIADFGTSELLKWARGDLAAKDLESFELHFNGEDGYDIL